MAKRKVNQKDAADRVYDFKAWALNDVCYGRSCGGERRGWSQKQQEVFTGDSREFFPLCLLQTDKLCACCAEMDEYMPI